MHLLLADADYANNENKFEALNPKQIQMTKIQNLKLSVLDIRSNFDIVSDFDIRYSELENP